ncbi:hypothetical protein LSAT2_013186 [Lamellibrachia satsuma]|nr:hypothetical protein LSAT2_013186 [Lamellibrachia satsuma]
MAHATPMPMGMGMVLVWVQERGCISRRKRHFCAGRRRRRLSPNDSSKGVWLFSASSKESPQRFASSDGRLQQTNTRHWNEDTAWKTGNSNEQKKDLKRNARNFSERIHPLLPAENHGRVNTIGVRSAMTFVLVTFTVGSKLHPGTTFRAWVSTGRLYDVLHLTAELRTEVYFPCKPPVADVPSDARWHCLPSPS